MDGIADRGFVVKDSRSRRGPGEVLQSNADRTDGGGWRWDVRTHVPMYVDVHTDTLNTHTLYFRGFKPAGRHAYDRQTEEHLYIHVSQDRRYRTHNVWPFLRKSSGRWLVRCGS